MGRKHKSLSTFNAHDSNTHCAVTNFKVKMSEVVERWDGHLVIAEAWHLRHPQDFPVIPIPQRVIGRTLTEDLTTDAVPTFDII